jgi:hypothetical protein
MSNAWVVGASPPRSPMDDVSRMFPKFVFGSFVESFGVSPSGELLLGLGEGGTVLASLIKTLCRDKLDNQQR